MTEKQIIKALLKMLREAHGAVQLEITATADDSHPVIAGKIKMLDRHEKRLAKLLHRSERRKA